MVIVMVEWPNQSHTAFGCAPCWNEQTRGCVAQVVKPQRWIQVGFLDGRLESAPVERIVAQVLAVNLEHVGIRRLPTQTFCCEEVCQEPTTASPRSVTSTRSPERLTKP